ncbi:hypothetical protein PX860_15575 [Agrobacterium leguminum]|uniref:hypothetical protein n=1 Tax=Agrobacterium leguminum TaxID=2792015 RepID=UPI00272BF064|nr:hypothetical protein [Agrobacterium leguminum]WLD98540.1 hypothetical protein PX860_15575 [Agrobacterium leguminum]
MRREHHVPLSKQALEVLTEMKELFGDKPYVFPSMMFGKKILSENSMNSALRRMGVKAPKSSCLTSGHLRTTIRDAAASSINLQKPAPGQLIISPTFYLLQIAG